MTVAYEAGWDATHSHLADVPKTGVGAGYTTGSPDIMWTEADWLDHPGAVRIDQATQVTQSDETADVLDVERGAATLADIPKWAHNALGNFRTGKRPGQRKPLVYVSLDQAVAAAQTLVINGMGNGEVGLYLAHWDITKASALAELSAHYSSVPVHAMQYLSEADYDIDVWSTAWLKDVSVAPDPDPKVPAPEPKTAVSLLVKFSDNTTEEVPL